MDLDTQRGGINGTILNSLNDCLWLSFKCLGNEITGIGESLGHELRVKSKDSNRAVVSCSRSGVYLPSGTKRCTRTIKCNCPFKINLKKGILIYLIFDVNNHWKVYNYQLDHNHELSMTSGLIKSYKKLSTLIWTDLRVGIIKGILTKILIAQIREEHPLARRVG